MAIALIANTAANSANSTSVTTSAIDTTGANLIVVAIADLTADSTTLTDSKGNTWTPLTTQDQATLRSRLYYCASPTVGSGHTFTGTSATTSYPSIAVVAFSGAHTSPFDQENGAVATGVLSIQTGSVTPTANDQVLVSGFSYTVTDTLSINGSFTISNQLGLSPGTAYGIGMAYKIQTTAGAENPTWSWPDSGANAATTIATFKAAGEVRKFILSSPA